MGAPVIDLLRCRITPRPASLGARNRSVTRSRAQLSGVKALAGDFTGDGFGNLALTSDSDWNTIPVSFGLCIRQPFELASSKRRALAVL